MGKAADVFKSSGTGFPHGRLIFMAVLLMLVVVAVVSVQSGLFKPRTPETAPSGVAPNARPAGNALAAGVSTDNDGVALKMRGTRTVAPPADNAALSAPPADNALATMPPDGTKMTYAETPAFYAYMLKAWKLGPNEPGPGHREPVVVSRADLTTDPATYRGRLVRLRGTLLDPIRPKTLNPDADNPDRPRLYYECYLKLVDEGVTIVSVFENPLDAGISPRRGSVVSVEGYFYRVLLYDAQGGTEHDAPMVMGYRLVRETTDSALTPLSALLLGGLIALIVVLWLFLRRGRRESEAARERLRRVAVDQIDIPEPQSLPRDKFYEEREKQTPPKTGA